MNGIDRKNLFHETPIDQIFRECFPKKMSREERRYTALLRAPYESGEIDSGKIIRLCELIKQISAEWGETKRAERVKTRFLRALWLPVEAFEEGEIPSNLVTRELTEEVREKTGQIVSDARSDEEELSGIITRATVNTVHLEAASIVKSNDKRLSSEERKFLIQISEWNLIGKVIGDKTMEILQKKVTEYTGEFPQENIENIKREYGGLSADSFCKVARKKKMVFDFRSFSPEAIEVLSPEVREFIFEMSRKGFLEKTFNPEIITEEQDALLRKNRPAKKRIFPHLRQPSSY